MTSTLTREALQARLDRFTRVPLAHLPTPLERCPHLSAALAGPDLYIKRDDLTGLAFGGNKTRQLEYLFADIADRGCDTVVAGAYTQSNWCRQITAAACKLGIKVELVLLHGEKGPARQGNLLLDDLMGANITITELETMPELPPLLERKADELRAQGRQVYVVNPFGRDTLARSALGYVRAAVELDAQLESACVNADYVYVAGANMTPAGLMLGMHALGRGTRVVNIAPIKWEEDRATDIARIAGHAAELLELGLILGPADIDSYDDYIGERYGVVTAEGREALRLTARTEGIILDPVYTSKAMAGLCDHVRSGKLHAGQSVVFVHTGGNPAVFAYAEDLTEDWPDEN